MVGSGLLEVMFEYWLDAFNYHNIVLWAQWQNWLQVVVMGKTRQPVDT